MSKINILFFIIIPILNYSCWSNRVVYNKGQCIQEINKQYVSSAQNNQTYIYKIEDTKSDFYTVSTWHNSSWLFLKEKPIDYFDESKNFTYKAISCPDIKDDRKALTDRVKDIDL